MFLIKCPNTDCVHKCRFTTFEKYGQCSKCVKANNANISKPDKDINKPNKENASVDANTSISSNANNASFSKPSDNDNLNESQESNSDELNENKMTPTKMTRSRKPFSNKFSTDLWKLHFGDTFEGLCFCKTVLIYPNFHIGHIKSFNDGGDESIENTIPICMSCNLSMKTTNLIDYYKTKYCIDIRTVDRKNYKEKAILELREQFEKLTIEMKKLKEIVQSL